MQGPGAQQLVVQRMGVGGSGGGGVIKDSARKRKKKSSTLAAVITNGLSAESREMCGPVAPMPLRT